MLRNEKFINKWVACPQDCKWRRWLLTNENHKQACQLYQKYKWRQLPGLSPTPQVSVRPIEFKFKNSWRDSLKTGLRRIASKVFPALPFCWFLYPPGLARNPFSEPLLFTNDFVCLVLVEKIWEIVTMWVSSRNFLAYVRRVEGIKPDLACITRRSWIVEHVKAVSWLQIQNQTWR